jgi:hypothetical protein
MNERKKSILSLLHKKWMNHIKILPALKKLTTLKPLYKDEK